MTRELLELQRDEHRVLAAVEFIDATSGARIAQPLRVAPADPATPAGRFIRNRGGLLVLWSHPALAAHAASFDTPPAQPALGSVALALRVADPAGRYQPRAFTLALPRDPDPAHAAQAGSLFRPLQVELFRSAAAPLVGNWTPLHVRVAESGGDLLGGALVEVRGAGNELLARGTTDWRGEALLPVAGLPITTWGADDGDVVVTETAATVHAFHVAALGTRTPAAQVAAGRASAAPPCPDPDVLGSHPQRVAATPQPVALAARRGARVALTVNLP